MNLITSIIKHCLADATLAGLFGIRIDRDIPAGSTLPAMGVVEITNTRRSHHLTDVRVSFIADAADFTTCETLRQRLGELFHMKAGASLTDGLVIASSIGADGDGTNRNDDENCWQFQQYYIFTITDVY